MALRFFTDFDEPVSDFTRLTGGPIWSGTVTSDAGDWSASWGEGSSNGLRFGDSWGNFALNVDPGNKLQGNTYIFGMRLAIPAYGSTSGGVNDPLLQFGHESGGYSFYMRRNNSTWDFLDYNGGTVAGSGGYLISNTLFTTVEIKVIQGDPGSAEVRFDGVTVWSGTGNFFGGNTEASPLNQIVFSGTNVNDHDSVYCDKMWLADGTGTYNNDFFGNIKAEYVAPTGNGATSNWVGSDGNSTDNYLLVDEDPMSMTDYIRGDTQGDIDLFTHASISTNPGIIAVNPIYLTDFPNGGVRYLRPVTRISAVNYTGTTLIGKDEGTLAWTHFFEEDPSTTSAWTASGVNAAEFGVELRDE